MDFYKKTIDETLQELHSSTQGLSHKEVTRRRSLYGANEITVKGEPLWRILVEPFASVFNAVLGVAVVISLWHRAYFDAAIIVGIVLISAVIYYVQRFSTDRILRSLKKKDAQSVSVLRGGETMTVAVANLVPGDIVRLGEGDKVPADIRILEAHSLRTNESMLTGESQPVEKSTEVLGSGLEVYERHNTLFQGSFLFGGRAVGVVTHIGNETEFGKIAALSADQRTSTQSPVQKKIDSLIGYCMATIVAISIVAFILAVLEGIPVDEALQFVIALAVSAVPEGLPVAISIILALGMRRMAKKKALVRSMRAIESIGVVTTIATDKTGTLTKNQLSVQEVWTPSWGDQSGDTTVSKRALVAYINQVEDKTADPLDVALSRYVGTEAQKMATGVCDKVYPFDQALSMSGNSWHSGNGFLVAIKGAPETLLAQSSLKAVQKEEVSAALVRFAKEGYRVIGLASAQTNDHFDSLGELVKHHPLVFHGLVAIADTLRPTAHAAIARAKRAGITVRMITGDHYQTAFSIGKKLGLVDHEDEVLDCREIGTLSEKELKVAVKKARVFARVTPENKFRILHILKTDNVVAMTGDGVNDVPALSSAHVGVAMGSGSEMAKDAGDILLLNDDFSRIIQAVREGRIIYANIRRMLFYLLSTNIGEVAVAVGALIIGVPLPLTPIQILWVNLVTDTTMVIPLGLEPGEKNILKQKPVSPKAPILSAYLVARVAIVAITMGVTVLSLYVAYTAHHSVAYAQTIAFFTLVIMQWANAFNARSTYESLFHRARVRHTAFWGGLGISIALQLLVFLGPLQHFFDIQPTSLFDTALACGIGVVAAIIPVELHKLWGRRR